MQQNQINKTKRKTKSEFIHSYPERKKEIVYPSDYAFILNILKKLTVLNHLVFILSIELTLYQNEKHQEADIEPHQNMPNKIKQYT